VNQLTGDYEKRFFGKGGGLGDGSLTFFKKDRKWINKKNANEKNASGRGATDWGFWRGASCPKENRRGEKHYKLENRKKREN